MTTCPPVPPPGHWIERYLGLPWVAGTGECWHRAALVWRERFGILVPLDLAAGADPRLGRRLLTGHGERQAWRRVEAARDGDGVLMARGRHPCHVGVAAAAGVLHCVEGAGTIWTPLPRLPSLGWRVEGLYRRAGA